MMSRKSADFRLLIVDDNEAIHNDLKKILLPQKVSSALTDDEALLFGKVVSHGIEFEIDSAFQGQEGLARLQEAQAGGRPYALAFIDIRMPPGWDGIETISHLWNTDPDLQIVICTAYSDHSWTDIEKHLGISDNLVILKKPFDPIEVTQLAHALTSKWLSARHARLRLEELDRLVEKRTADLRAAVREMKEAKELAETVALQDPLTKLPNRRLFQNRLTLAIQHAARNPAYLCALLYLDLDRFKVVNDSLGHLAGDELLIEVAQRIESSLRSGQRPCSYPKHEDLVARLGGDEFAIFLDDIRDVSDALRVANRISEKLAEPFCLRDRDVAVSGSIGVATSSSHYETADNMLRDADTAMYRAKAAGRGGSVLFDQSMHLQAVERLHKESEMRQALERGEYFLCYQPIVSLMDWKIDGFEALLRWRSPTRGVVSPEDFIPLAEETGLILPIGAWVLHESCLQVRRWQELFGADPPLSVSVNISARQFSQPDLVDLVKQTLSETRVSGRNLRLELTESVAMEEPERAAPLFRELQQLGVRLSIDDFGTGYSSLSHLHRFSVDTLKIDRYFVGNMEVNERNLNIVRTIVSLARNLGMEVVAEGAETSTQVNLLRSMSCKYVQGYFFSKPAERAAVESLLAANPDFRIPLTKGVAQS
jgi:diguanylate cyclase (GGDEF)-like protein